MRITVTRRDIMCGTAGDPERCPVARAIFRATGELVQVSSGYVNDGTKLFTVPLDVTQFIRDFDRSPWTHRLFIQPFSFELAPVSRDLPEAVEEHAEELALV